MGRLLREMMDEDIYTVPSPDMIPELMLLGNLVHHELALELGTVVKITAIEYEGRTYQMKVEDGGRWFDKSPRR
jgi:hypothetical protein